VVDLVSVVPYYVSLVFESGGGRSENGKFVTGCHGSVRGGGVETGTSLMYLRTIRLVRVVRILKLTKHCLGLQVTYSLQLSDNGGGRFPKILNLFRVGVPSGYLEETSIFKITRGQYNLTKSASRGAHFPVRGHPRGSKVVPLNSWGRVSY